VEYKSKNDTRSNRGKWNHFKITQTIPEQIPGKHKIKGLKNNSHIGHSTHTTASANVKVQNIFHGRNNITCSTNCKYRTAATLYTLETLICFRYIIVNTLHKGNNKGGGGGGGGGGDDDDDHHHHHHHHHHNNNNTKACVIKITVTMITLQ